MPLSRRPARPIPAEPPVTPTRCLMEARLVPPVWNLSVHRLWTLKECRKFPNDHSRLRGRTVSFHRLKGESTVLEHRSDNAIACRTTARSLLCARHA